MLGRRPAAQARPAGARGAPDRRVRARLERGAGARGRRRRGRARPQRRARARDRVHERGREAARRGLPAARRVAPRRPAEALVPRLDLRGVGARLGLRRGVALARAQNEPGELVVRSAEPVGEPTDVPGAYRVDRVDPAALAAGRIWPQSRGSQLAALVVGSRDGERILDACAAPGGKATMLRGAVTAVEVHAGPRARARGERAPARRGERPRRERRRPRARRGRASTARSSTRRARGSACSAAAPTSAGARSRCRSSSSSSCARRPSARGPAARSSTRSAR